MPSKPNKSRLLASLIKQIKFFYHNDGTSVISYPLVDSSTIFGHEREVSSVFKISHLPRTPPLERVLTVLILHLVVVLLRTPTIESCTFMLTILPSSEISREFLLTS